MYNIEVGFGAQRKGRSVQLRLEYELKYQNYNKSSEGEYGSGGGEDFEVCKF